MRLCALACSRLVQENYAAMNTATPLQSLQNVLSAKCALNTRLLPMKSQIAIVFRNVLLYNNPPEKQHKVRIDN